MKIENYKIVERPNSPMKATFEVVIPEWDFTMSLAYFEKGSGQSWFGYPSREYMNDKGEKKYKWLAHFGEKGKARFETALKKELEKFLNMSKQDTLGFDEEEIPF